MFCGVAIECGDPGACVTPVEVTVNTYNLPAVSLIAYRWFALSQNIWRIRFVVSSPVNFVIAPEVLNVELLAVFARGCGC
jgi:hypothetical protein